ncbi:membrane protein, putative [Minicystis rosea]|nr:membrane protein, putative [Minicystis rosea]
MSIAPVAALAAASVVAGLVNAVAGGGSLVSFPAAVAFGLPSLIANATNAVALTPGSIASAYAYRRELARDRAALEVLLPPALAGGLVGSILLLVTPQKVFDTIVPLLVLFATALLFRQNLRRKQEAPEGAAWVLPQSNRVTMLLQFLVGVYGGYFGAGMGIMMLAILGRLGGVDIHGMNGVKSVLAAAINAIAAVAFIVAGAVDYRVAGIMAAGAIVGGFAGAAMARKVKPVVVRWMVVAIGVVLTGVLGYRRFLGG